MVSPALTNYVPDHMMAKGFVRKTCRPPLAQLFVRRENMIRDPAFESEFEGFLIRGVKARTEHLDHIINLVEELIMFLLVQFVIREASSFHIVLFKSKVSGHSRTDFPQTGFDHRGLITAKDVEV